MLHSRLWPSLLACFVACGAQGLGAQTPATTPTSTPAVYPTQTALGARIQALLATGAAAQAHWGIAVTTEDGTPVYGLDEATLFRPASTAKLFTTAAAIAVLGPNFTTATTISGDLDAGTGTVRGDLTLSGGGDSDFNTGDLPYRLSSAPPSPSTDLAGLVDQLVAKGVHRITGDVIGNDDLFGYQAPPEGWAAEDLLWGYGALPSALSIGDNEIKFTLAPGPSPTPGAQTGGNASITLDQLVPYIHIEDEVTNAPAGTTPAASITLPPVSEPIRQFPLRGSIAMGRAPLLEHLAVPEPALYAAEALRQMLVDHGIEVTGATRAHHALTQTSEPYLKAWRAVGGCGWAYPGEPNRCVFDCPSTPHSTQALATHTSAPLVQDVTFTLKTSANLHAENLLGQLALKNACPGSAAVNGAGLVRTWLLHAGLLDGDFVFYDGSGLSTKDLVTPRAEAALLAYAVHQPWFAQWKSALPVGGIDGTLASRFTGPLKGKVFAKTGTLGETRALAGYVQCASGRELIFSILEDGHMPSDGDTATLDRVVDAIAELD